MKTRYQKLLSASQLNQQSDNEQAKPTASFEMNQILALQRTLLEKIATRTSCQDIIEHLCRKLEDILIQVRAAVVLRDANNGVFSVSCAPSLPQNQHQLLASTLPQHHQEDSALCTEQPLFIRDTQVHPHWQNIQPIAQSLNIRSCWSYPIFLSGEQFAGSISLLREEPGSPTPFSAQLLETAAHIIGIALLGEQSQRALENTESQLKNIASSLPGAVLQTRFTAEGFPYISYVSEGIEPLLGISATRAKRNFYSLWECFSETDRLHLLRYFKRHPKDMPFSRDCQIEPPRKGTKWVQLASTPEYDEQGKLLSVNSILLDHTREKEAHRQLELAGIAFASTNEGIIVTDHRQFIVDINRAYCTMSGYQKEELIGGCPSILCAWQERDSKLRYIDQQLQYQDHWQGEIIGRRKQGEVFTQWVNINVVRDERGRISHYVYVAADITDIKASEAKLHYMKQHDTLTDLPNRLLFDSLVDHCIKTSPAGQLISVMMLDLDRFKHINETLGHQAGDQLLLQATRRLRDTLDSKTIIARVGGDEFALLIHDCNSLACLEDRATELLKVMEQPFELSGQKFYTTATIGLSIYPEHGQNSEVLIKNADAAVHTAKRTSRNHFTFYQTERTQVVEEWVRLESALRQALPRGQFDAYFQPQVDPISGRAMGAEALLRWKHPELGQVPPSQFIPILEEIGLMCEVGHWVLEQACQELAHYRDHGNGQPFRIAVNVSSRQFLQGDLVAQVAELLERYQLDPQWLELEIVETLVMEHADAVKPVLQALRDMNVRLALDDFGTGHSSLSYLKQLPVQKLKIDQSMVFDIQNEQDQGAIAGAVVALGHRLGMTICAEGVENDIQRAFLVREQCDQIQGYLISRPLTRQAFRQWLANQAVN